MTRRTISSSMTFFSKRVSPTIMIPCMVIGMIAMLVRIPQSPELLFVVIGLGAAIVYLFWFAARLKYVAMDDHALFVSDGRRELEIPFFQIEQVRETFFSNPKMIILDLKWASEFGWKIVFMPNNLPWYEWYSVFGSHPLVNELERRALKAVMQINL